MKDTDKAHGEHLEVVDDELSDQELDATAKVMGAVKLTVDQIIYIPTPTAIHEVRPISVATFGVALVSRFGGILTFCIPEYSAAGKDYADINALMTYPTLFMGIGNLIGMPLAIGVGRRIVVLGFTLALILGASLCAVAKTYEWHLAARMILGLCAGQSEALVPMITREVFFLHERSKYLMTQQAIHVALTTIYVLFGSSIAGAITPAGWYWLRAGLAGLQFLIALFLLPETRYDRNQAAYQGDSVSENIGKADPEANTKVQSTSRVCKVKPPLDYVHDGVRTW
ncbi:hypothetical protein N7451_001373 [Penicillium sp. IBT 35674x]|nr:hypothetical protein N7451_001373 [Penicillium sp. IBT 35674x]